VRGGGDHWVMGEVTEVFNEVTLHGPFGVTGQMLYYRCAYLGNYATPEAAAYAYSKVSAAVEAAKAAGEDTEAAAVEAAKKAKKAVAKKAKKEAKAKAAKLAKLEEELADIKDKIKQLMSTEEA